MVSVFKISKLFDGVVRRRRLAQLKKDIQSRVTTKNRIGIIQVWVGPPRCPDTFLMEVHIDSPIVDVGLLIADRLCVPLTPPLRLYSQGNSLSNDKRVKYYCLGDQSRLGVYGELLGGSNENSKIIFEMENDLHSSFGTGVTQDLMDTHHEEDLNADQLLQLRVNCADNKKEMIAARKRQNSKARYEAMKMLPNARELMNASNEKSEISEKQTLFLTWTTISPHLFVLIQ